MSGDESDVSSVHSSDVSSVHSSDLSDYESDDAPAPTPARAGKRSSGASSSGAQPRKKKKLSKKLGDRTLGPANPRLLRPTKPKDGSVEAVKASQAHMYLCPLPTRDEADGCLVFEDVPDFRPNLSPAEIMKRGSFGGGYYRTIESLVTGLVYREAWKEFPQEWFEGVNVPRQVSSPVYKNGTNRYGVKCGQNLQQWEEQGWMEEVDPFGWFQWYCRFYLGRRSYDDERQIGRGLRCFGPTGRWRARLCNLVNSKGGKHNTATISPVIRQTLQHWGYRLTQLDYEEHCERKGLSV